MSENQPEVPAALFVQAGVASVGASVTPEPEEPGQDNQEEDGNGMD